MPVSTTNWLSASSLSAAHRLRTLYGLRADTEYLVKVAQDPTATSDLLGIPLLPHEVLDLRARAESVDKIAFTVRQYGERHREDWGGMFVDEAHGGTVVAWFSANVDGHKSALEGLVGPLALVEVRASRWTLSELESYAAAIEAEKDWFTTISAQYVLSEVSQIDNVVDLFLSTANPEAASLSIGHFGSDGWLRVSSDGVGPWTGPVGELVIRIVGTNGEPVGAGEWLCHLTPDELAAYSGQILVARHGECRPDSPVGATGYDVVITMTLDTTQVIVATGRVLVEPDRETLLTLMADQTSP